MILDQSKYLSLLIKRVYLTLLSIIALLLLSLGFLVKKLFEVTKADPVYVVFPDQTFAASRSEASLARSEYELVAFASLFLEKALAHHEYSWEENMQLLSGWTLKVPAYFCLKWMKRFNRFIRNAMPSRVSP